MDAKIITAAVQAAATALNSDIASRAVEESYAKLKSFLAEKGVDVRLVEDRPNSSARAKALADDIEEHILSEAERQEAINLAEKLVSDAKGIERTLSRERVPSPRRGNDYEKSDADRTPLRGALKLEVSTSTPTISAGKEFSIYVVIRNPFPVPVIVTSTETHIPVELSDEIWRSQRDTSEATTFENTLAKGQFSRATKLLSKIGFRLKCIKRQLLRDAGPRIAVAVSPHTYDEVRRIAVPVIAMEDVTASGYIHISDVIHNKFDLHFSGYGDDEVKNLVETLNKQVDGDISVLLNPGDSYLLTPRFPHGGIMTGFPAKALAIAWSAVRPYRRPVAMTEAAAA